jgi:phosphoketolase
MNRTDKPLSPVPVMVAFDTRVQTDLDLFHLVQDNLIEQNQYIDNRGQDMPEIRNWKGGSH